MAEQDEQREELTPEREDRHMIHVHTYLTETDVADGHQHMVMGVSSPARVAGASHVHRLRSRTSFYAENTGHWHWVDIMTGPAVALPDGTHVHYFSGNTSTDDGHCHAFNGATGLGPADYVEDECDDDDPPMPHYKHHKR